MSQQLTFDLPKEPALGREDFFVSPANAAAVDVIQGWHDWPLGKMILVGPEGAGKTHLAHVFAAMTGARIVDADAVSDPVAALALGAIAVEDVDQIAHNREHEEALFHLHNLAQSEGVPLLLTASAPPARWNLALPDLQSRMQGTAMVSLAAPDDRLLTAILAKLFGDRQLIVEPDLLHYLVQRMERSFAGAGRLVDALDQAALAQKRRITKQLAGPVLDKMDSVLP